MKTTDFYLIRCLSNLHVGSGEGDFSVIDKRVQRDQVTDLPTIHASGIKGALRESMESEAKNNGTLSGTITEVFGSDPKERDNVSQGKYHFFDGQLLALPARSNHDFFYVVSCPAILQEAEAKLDQLKASDDFKKLLEDLIEKAEALAEDGTYFGKEQSGSLKLEEQWTLIHDDYPNDKLKEYFGPRFGILTNEAFTGLMGELPIVARNYLNNGISKNLWYEEYVPREARFLTMVSKEEGHTGLEDFLKNKNHLAQLGANATVGYGLCEFQKL